MSYTPTNWQTGDTVTAQKLNKMEQGIAEVAKLSPSSDPYVTGQIIRYLAGSGMVADSINSVVEPFAYYFDIDVDENLNFTTDITRQTLAWDKWAYGISIYANVAGFLCPLYAAPFSSDALFYGPSFQTNIIALDDIGLTNYVGYLSIFPDFEGAGYLVTLIKWLLD